MTRSRAGGGSSFFSRRISLAKIAMASHFARDVPRMYTSSFPSRLAYIYNKGRADRSRRRLKPSFCQVGRVSYGPSKTHST